METQRLRQWERYIQIQDQFEAQQEYLRELSENPDFLEHVARESLRIVGENEVLFHFE
jgi:cell division protein FtsB